MPTSLFLINGEPQNSPLPQWYSHLGFGVFETFLIRRNGPGLVVNALSQHLERLRKGADTLAIKMPDFTRIREVIRSAAEGVDWNNQSALRARLILLRNDWILTLEGWTPSLSQDQGIAVTAVRAERPLPEIKSCSAMVSVLAHDRAMKQGSSEALLSDKDGFVREGAWSNFFWVDREGSLITPTGSILLGITRFRVLQIAPDICKVSEENFQLWQIIMQISEGFITQATHGIVPVVSIDGVPVGDGKPGPITRKLIERYTGLSGEIV